MESMITRMFGCCCKCLHTDVEEKETLYKKRPSLYVAPAPGKLMNPRSHSITSEVDFYVPRKDSDCSFMEADGLTDNLGRKCSLPSTLSSGKRLSVTSIDTRRYSVDGYAMEPIGELKPELYRRHYSYDDIITTSDIIEDYLGTVVFSIQYEATKNRILVHVEEVCDLPCRGEDSSYDTLLVLTLLPGEKYTQPTKIINNCLHPVFNEKLYFPISSTEEAFGKTLRISVCEFDNQKKQNVIGHALLEIDADILDTIALKHFDMQFTKESEVLLDRGRMFMSVSYNDDQLSVRVQRASGLKAASNASLYVKVCLMCGGEKVKTKRGTSVENMPADIEFHQTFDFVLPKKHMEDSCFIVTILQKGKLRNETPLGRVVLGPFFYSKDRVLTHWGKVMFSNKQVDDWYALTL